MRRASIAEEERIERERKGAFYTPPAWVELSQQYLAEELGEGWQEEYYVWDCAAGIGNLLAGLECKERLFGSTLDARDVPVMRKRYPDIPNSHLFQFDFLSDPIEKVPAELRRVLEDPKRRERLVIYINPPYAEATNSRTAAGSGRNRPGVTTSYAIKREANAHVGGASNELFALFLYRIQRDFDGCVIGNFSTLKLLQATNFQRFRDHFRGELRRLFVVPAQTFDNVSGRFPIGFHVWQTNRAPLGNQVRARADVYDLREGETVRLGTKLVANVTQDITINRWYMDLVGDYMAIRGEDAIGWMGVCGPDYQNNQYLHVANAAGSRHVSYVPIVADNFTLTCVYLAVRLCIASNWLNQSDPFFVPEAGWEGDAAFHGDCIAYVLFSGKNLISSAGGVANHWIPFAEGEVEPRGGYTSRWMVEFLAGRLEASGQNGDGIVGKGVRPWATGRTLILFSPEAQLVLDAGRELFRYYHRQRGSHPDASFYDIRAHFQGFTRGGTGKAKMNPKSSDAQYMELLEGLRAARERLARKIAPKVYQYGFLLGESEG